MRIAKSVWKELIATREWFTHLKAIFLTIAGFELFKATATHLSGPFSTLYFRSLLSLYGCHNKSPDIIHDNENVQREKILRSMFCLLFLLLFDAYWKPQRNDDLELKNQNGFMAPKSRIWLRVNCLCRQQCTFKVTFKWDSVKMKAILEGLKKWSHHRSFISLKSSSIISQQWMVANAN